MRKLKAEEKWLRRLQRAGSMLELLDSGGGCKGLQGGQLIGLRVLLPARGRGDVLLIAQARVGTEKYVGFCGGPDIVTALLTWLKKEASQGMQYRVDQPYQPPDESV